MFIDIAKIRVASGKGGDGKVGEIRAAQHIFDLQSRDGLVQMQHGGKDGFGAAYTDTNQIITCF